MKSQREIEIRLKKIDSVIKTQKKLSPEKWPIEKERFYTGYAKALEWVLKSDLLDLLFVEEKQEEGE